MEELITKTVDSSNIIWILVALSLRAPLPGALGTKRTNPTVDVTIPAPVAAWPPQHRYASASRIQWASANRTNPCVPVAHHLPHRGAALLVSDRTPINSAFFMPCSAGNFEYHASEMELEWSTIAQKGSICKLAKKQKEQVSRPNR